MLMGPDEDESRRWNESAAAEIRRRRLAAISKWCADAYDDAVPSVQFYDVDVPPIFGALAEKPDLRRIYECALADGEWLGEFELYEARAKIFLEAAGSGEWDKPVTEPISPLAFEKKPPKTTTPLRMLFGDDERGRSRVAYCSTLGSELAPMLKELEELAPFRESFRNLRAELRRTLRSHHLEDEVRVPAGEDSCLSHDLLGLLGTTDRICAALLPGRTLDVVSPFVLWSVSRRLADFFPGVPYVSWSDNPFEAGAKLVDYFRREVRFEHPWHVSRFWRYVAWYLLLRESEERVRPGRHRFAGQLETLRRRGRILLRGGPKTGKSALASRLASEIAGKGSEDGILRVADGRPREDGLREFRARAEAEPGRNFALVVDEFDPARASEAFGGPFPPADDPFPPNLHVICAAKSESAGAPAAGAWFAGRFPVATLCPDAGQLPEKGDARELFRAVENYVRESVPRELREAGLEELPMPGHGFFMTEEADELAESWRSEILPLLVEWNREGLLLRSPLLFRHRERAALDGIGEAMKTAAGLVGELDLPFEDGSILAPPGTRASRTRLVPLALVEADYRWFMNEWSRFGFIWESGPPDGLPICWSEDGRCCPDIKRVLKI